MLQKLYLIHISDIDIPAGKLYNMLKNLLNGTIDLLKKEEGKSYE